MKSIATAVLLASASATQMDWSIVDQVNSLHTTWTAAVPERFMNATLDEIVSLLGTKLKKSPGYVPIELPPRPETVTLGAVPASFDSRTQWPSCSVIGHVRDQSACGSCWAFASTEALNDRICIATGDNTMLSAEHTNDCCTNGSSGCNGGQPAGAWSWFVSSGVVSGGDQSTTGTGATCMPYSFPACAHHVTSPTYPACPSGEYNTPSCKSYCTEKTYATTFSADKRHAKTSYYLSSVSAIQQDIMTYGPVTAAFEVYSDFPTYTSGVYHHVSGSYLGGHAVKVIGWGVENNTPYWLVVNSWNESWGDNGTFKIKRGNDECGIEDEMVAGHV